MVDPSQDASEAANTLLSFASVGTVDCYPQLSSTQSSITSNPYNNYTHVNKEQHHFTNDNTTNQSTESLSTKKNLDTPSSLTNLSNRSFSHYSSTAASRDAYYGMESSPLWFFDINAVLQGTSHNIGTSSPTSFVVQTTNIENDNTTTNNEQKAPHSYNNLCNYNHPRNRTTTISEGSFVTAIRRFPPFASSQSSSYHNSPLIIVQGTNSDEQPHYSDLTKKTIVHNYLNYQRTIHWAQKGKLL